MIKDGVEAQMANADTRMDPSIDSAFKQNIPSLDHTATYMTIPESTAPTTMKQRIILLAAERDTLVPIRRVPGGLLCWQSTDRVLQHTKAVEPRLHVTWKWPRTRRRGTCWRGSCRA
jgi:hypothetical protein